MLLNNDQNKELKSTEDIDALLFLEEGAHGFMINANLMLNHIKKKMEQGKNKVVLGLESFPESRPSCFAIDGTLTPQRIPNLKKYFTEYRGNKYREMACKQYLKIITELEKYVLEGRLKIVSLQEPLGQECDIYRSEDELGEKFKSELDKLRTDSEYISPFFEEQWQTEYRTLRLQLEALNSRQSIIWKNHKISQLSKKIEDTLKNMEYHISNNLSRAILAKFRSKGMVDAAVKHKNDGDMVIFIGSGHRDMVNFFEEVNIKARSADNHLVRSKESLLAIKEHSANESDITMIEKDYLSPVNNTYRDYNTAVKQKGEEDDMTAWVNITHIGKYLADNKLFPPKIARDQAVHAHFKKVDLPKPLEQDKPTYSPSTLRKNNTARTLIRSYEEERQHYEESMAKLLRQNPRQQLIAEAEDMLNKLRHNSKTTNNSIDCKVS